MRRFAKIATSRRAKTPRSLRRAPGAGVRESAGRTGLAFHLRDLILGGQDGLVNVLGLVLGLTAAGSETRTIVVGGLAALLAESIAMAGVMYTSASAEVLLLLRARARTA